ncbi:MAG: MATE family efflux transporter [Rhodospirillales bacterium]
MDTPPPIQPTRIEIEGFSGRLRRHSTELVRLATPIVISRSGFLFLVMADTVMTGRFDAEELAYLAIGLGLIMPMMITSLGMIMGTLVLTANAFGGGRAAECGPIWRRSLSYAFVLGLICVGVGSFGNDLLLLTGQTADVAKHGGEIMWIISLGLPGHLLFLSSAYFLEGIGRPTHSMVIMILANVLNVGLNWLLIDGPWLSEPLGGTGAAWATTAARWFMAISMAVIVWNLRDRDRFSIRTPLSGGFRGWQELRRIGYAIGLSVGVEALAFAVLNAYAGWLGKIPLAAYGLTLNLMALAFMLALGIGSATAVRVGIAFGRGDIPDAALAGWTGLGANVLVMCSTGLIAFFFDAELAGFYTDNPVLLAEAAVTVAFITWIFVPDGGQAVMANALRGRKDVWMPTIIQTASFFGVMVPFGYVSAFVWDNGTVGLFQGILAGCIVSLAALSIRFHMLSKKVPGRAGG